MQDAGPALMGVGQASGETRAADATKQAISSPLLEVDMSGAECLVGTLLVAWICHCLKHKQLQK